MLTAAEFERIMNELKMRFEGDKETFRICANRLMCETLRTQGYDAGVKIFENMVEE